LGEPLSERRLICALKSAATLQAAATINRSDAEEIPMLDVVTKPALSEEIAADDRISMYQPEQKGLIFPEIPKFDSFAEERLDRKKRLVAACRAFARERFDYGFAGHLTIRDPEHPELYWTNPVAVHFGLVKLSNLILVDHEGQIVEGKHAVNRAGFVLHAAVHAAHPDIISMCHAHTIYGTAFAATGKKLLPISQDAAAFYEDHAIIGEDAGQVVLEVQAGHSIASAFKGIKAAIHQNHGLFSVSRHSIDAAAFWFMALERCCQQQLAVEATGVTPILVAPKNVQYSREHLGTDYIGWLNFQPTYEYLTATQPDMFT
jgi:ribulose-5-phosphate 4-epimerase/fuculose-1-phosphate aldolase